MIPVCLNGFPASVYFPPSSSAAVFGGPATLWAGADRIRAYALGPHFPATRSNWVVAGVLCAYGVFSMIVGRGKKERFYGVCGRRSALGPRPTGARGEVRARSPGEERKGC